MRVAIIGSRTLFIDSIEQYLPENTTEIISGGAKGIDACAAEYAKKYSIPLTEILPDYRRYGRGAPLKRNLEIIQKADFVLAFWDMKSRGTKHIIDNCHTAGIAIQVISIPDSSAQH